MKPIRIVFLLLIPICLGGVAYVNPPLRAAALVALGRASVCPLDRARQADAEEKRQIAIKDRILAASKLVRTDDQGLELWDTPKGQFWIPKGNRYVLPFNLAEMERKIYGEGEHFIHPGDIVLDCGASDGDFDRVALDAGAKIVVAIEIAPKNIECLRRNLAQEIKDGRVIVYPKGVWDKDDILPLVESDTNFAADSVVMHPEGSKTTINVPLTTIDKMVAELNLPRVDFIKMDIEGAEPKALEGGRATIARFHPRMALSAYHQPDHPVLIPAKVKDIWSGYTMACGPCAEDRENHRIRPDILYFW